MTEILTSAQMRALEQDAIQSRAVTGLDLMERAGQGVVDAMLEWRPDLATTSHRAVVLCGPGNNGGDGFVVARLLHQRGWQVEVFLYGDETKLPPDAAENARRWRALGDIGDVLETRTAHLLGGHNKKTRRWSTPPIETWDDAIVIDAVFGIGLTRPIDEQLREVFFDLSRFGCLGAVAIDLPTGLSADTGQYVDFTKSELSKMWEAIEFQNEADLTVTFHGPKLGHLLGIGPRACGHLMIADIGLSPSELFFDETPIGDIIKQIIRSGTLPVPKTVSLVGPPDASEVLVRKQQGRHKYDHGHALVLSGGVGRGGAARLTARGALRIGAGLVTVGCPPSSLIENAARLDAIMLTALKEVDDLATEIAARKINAVCIGPGFGLGERLRNFVSNALAAEITLVLDADAITEFRDDPQTLFDMLHDGCVLTPHSGEFNRLFPDLAKNLNAPLSSEPHYSKVDATREAAARAGCVVLFKGADTVIARPDGRCSINSAHYGRAAPWLATAGSGDVLAGFITGLLAQGSDPMQAAETAAWLHVECARAFGPGLIAEDLPEQLPRVLRDLLK